MPVPEPKATTAPRNYRVLAINTADPEIVTDYGFYPGREPDAALKVAEAQHPEELKGDGTVSVAIPETYWRPVKRAVEMVETVTYKPWTPAGTPEPEEEPDE